ncbi:hypothetical protein E4U61_006131, partial [Claviceps capensis]
DGTEIFEDGTEIFEDGTEIFEDGTEIFEDGTEEEEFSHEALDLHLLPAYVERYRTGMHPEAICAETVHLASVIPDFPISAKKGFVYVIDTRETDKDDLAEPWNAEISAQEV